MCVLKLVSDLNIILVRHTYNKEENGTFVIQKYYLYTPLTRNIEKGRIREKINSSPSLTCDVCLILHFRSINCQICSHICHPHTLITLIRDTCESSNNRYKTEWFTALSGNCLTCSKYEGITLWNICDRVRKNQPVVAEIDFEI